MRQGELLPWGLKPRWAQATCNPVDTTESATSIVNGRIATLARECKPSWISFRGQEPKTDLRLSRHLARAFGSSFWFGGCKQERPRRTLASSPDA